MSAFQSNRRRPRRAVLGLLFFLSFGMVLNAGCQSWRSRDDSATLPTVESRPGGETKKRRWLESLLPPRGEYFYDERSHDIERSLQHRGPNVSF